MSPLGDPQLTAGEVKQLLDRASAAIASEDAIIAFVDQQQLTGRQVFSGETLLEIMDEHGLWRLELEIPEDRLHHLRHGISVAEMIFFRDVYPRLIEHSGSISAAELPSQGPAALAARRIQHRGCSVSGGRVRE